MGEKSGHVQRIRNETTGIRETAQQLRAFTVLAENPSWIPRLPRGCLQSSVALLSEDLVPSSSVVCECQIYTWYTYKHADKTLINKYNYKREKELLQSCRATKESRRQWHSASKHLMEIHSYDTFLFSNTNIKFI